MVSAVSLARMAADLQQRQDQRIEFMAHRQAGEGHGGLGPDAADGERGLALVLAVERQRNLVGDGCNVFQQRPHFLRLVALVQRADQLDRMNDTFEIGFQLRFDGVVQHGAGSGI